VNASPVSVQHRQARARRQPGEPARLRRARGRASPQPAVLAVRNPV